MVVQMELFPDVVVVATPAIAVGESFVAQCSWCGLLVCAAHEVELEDCPACRSSRAPGYKHSWWRQELDVGPFRHT